MKSDKSNGTNYALRKELLHKIMLFGIGISIIVSIEDVLVYKNLLRSLPLIGLILVFTICLVVYKKFDNVEFGARFMAIAAVFVVFPYIFFTNGAIEGGSSLWFVLGIFYIIGIFHGPEMAAFLVLAIIVDVVCYVISYLHPELVVPLISRRAVYIDSLYAVLSSSLLIGILTKYQLWGYEKTSRLAMRQRDEIEELANSRSAFFASMSHEIRTPINTIIGLNEMIMREENISEEAAEDAANIQNASKMLLSLVNDILDMSQIENNKMEILETDYSLKDMVAELVDMINVRLVEKKLEFYVDVDANLPSVLHGDDKRIKQVVLNLLTNAAKYTKKGSVSFTVNGEKLGEEFCRLEIAVKDTGVGIKTENLDSLFESFQRMDNEVNRGIEGTGLGLSISKQLVDLMGGQIVVDSIYTKGSTFTVIIEQKIVDNRPVGRIDFLSKSKSRRGLYHQCFEAPEARILVVDDNDMNRMVVEKLLRSTKLKIDKASNGREALKLTQSNFYNLILMDYMMPEMSGDETTAMIRRQDNGLNRDTPVVVLTADAMSRTRTNYMEMGFDAFLEKPFNGLQLERVVLSFLPEDLLEYRINEKEEWSASYARLANNEKRQKRIILTTDCNCDISRNICESFDIRMMYMYISTDKGRFCDTKEINTDNLTRILNDNKNLIKVAPASVQDYENFFAECLVEAQDVIHISVGKKIGPNYMIAHAAAKGFGHVHVIDSEQTSSGMALMLMRLGAVVNQGASVDMVLEKAEELKKKICCHVLTPGVVDVSRTRKLNNKFARFTEKLSIHSVTNISHDSNRIEWVMGGRLDICYRKLIRHLIKDRRKIDYNIIYISHGAISLESQKQILDEINQRGRFKNILVECCSVSNACYAGLGTIAVAYLKY